jgi:hypothetical protein
MENTDLRAFSRMTHAAISGTGSDWSVKAIDVRLEEQPGARVTPAL